MRLTLGDVAVWFCGLVTWNTVTQMFVIWFFETSV